jgi:hypothetical protein
VRENGDQKHVECDAVVSSVHLMDGGSTPDDGKSERHERNP